MRTAARKSGWLASFLLAGIAGSTPSRSALGVVTIGACGYIGGDQGDGESGHPPGIAVGPDGSAYVTGYTRSAETTFPATVGPDLTYNASGDAFVARVRPDFTGLVYAGYVGGEQDESGLGIAVDAAGSAYLSGWTASNERSFPVTVGPDLTHNDVSGSWDAFVAKVSADGASLLYAGYIGSELEDGGLAIAVDAAGNGYVTGGAWAAGFPVVVGPDLSHNGGLWDGFVAKVRADGTGLFYCGYIGGNDWERPTGIALDPAGSAYVHGRTTSAQATFPERVGPDLTYAGSGDAFVAKVRTDGTGLVYAGYLGGRANEWSGGIAVDPAGSAYLTGSTYSDFDFPRIGGPDLSFNDGIQDAFVAKVRPDGTALDYAGYVGGDGFDWGVAIAVDAAGSALVVGTTPSTEATFPVSGGPDSTHNGDQDAFVARVRPDGTSLEHAGYVGGSEADIGAGVALDAAGKVYIYGTTGSDEATFPVVVGPDLTYRGGGDAFVARLGESACAVPPEVIAGFLAVKPLRSRDDVAMSWQPDLGANGYNVWLVEDKRLIDSARQSGAPPAVPVAGCAWPMPASGSTCTDVGGVRRGSPTPFFYQVRAFCDAASEGP